MKEYDKVELIVDGYDEVPKGSFGCVMCDKPIDGKWYVIFSEFYTAKDIADISVREEDLQIHEFVPKDKFPKPPKGFTKEDLKDMGYPFWETYEG